MTEEISWDKIAKILKDKGISVEENAVLQYGKKEDGTIWVYMDGSFEIVHAQETKGAKS